MGDLAEAPSRETKDDGGPEHLEQEPRFKGRDDGVSLAYSDRKDRVADAPGGARQVADDTRDERGEEMAIGQTPDHEHFDGEQRAGQRRAEDRAESGGDAGNEHRASGRRVQSAELGKGIGQTSPICTAVPSRPPEPPPRWVASVPKSTSGAIRAGTPPPGA
jgi:hypothetical protein